MGVFYDVRVHLAESGDDYQGKKSSTVAMGIRKVIIDISTLARKAKELTLARKEGSHFHLNTTFALVCFCQQVMQVQINVDNKLINLNFSGSICSF